MAGLRCWTITSTHKMALARLALKRYDLTLRLRSSYPRPMTRRLPPLNALRAFEAAARRGGFAKAAGELAVTPAAVSQQVRLLEAALGGGLVRRLPRGLELTPAGR